MARSDLDNSSIPSSSPDSRSDRRRKALALLAAGTVLGVGAAVTLAVWNDSEVATADFGTGNFGIQGSENGTAFASHPDLGSAAELTFETEADNLSPLEPVYAPFAIRLNQDTEPDSTLAGTIDLSGDVVTETNGLAAELTYSIYSETTFGCTETDTATPTSTLLVDSAPFDASVTADVFELDALADVENLCLVVEGSTDLPQGAAAQVAWSFDATSTTQLLP